MTNNTRDGAKAERQKPGPKPSSTLLEALCNECGNVRTAKEAHLRTCDRRGLKCDVCGRVTVHYPIGAPGPDSRQEDNAKQNAKNALRLHEELAKEATLQARLQQSLALFEQLGVRFELVETDEWYAKIWRERGRGSETCFIDLPADLACGPGQAPCDRLALPAACG
jgi:ribosomal protein S27E